MPIDHRENNPLTVPSPPQSRQHTPQKDPPNRPRLDKDKTRQDETGRPPVALNSIIAHSRTWTYSPRTPQHNSLWVNVLYAP
jgi:hypothetical protein